MRRKPQPLPPPKACPVCLWNKRDPLAIAAHNLACALFGERTYHGRPT
jgi:hypothetical protein